MTLIKCSECGQEVSTEAKVCPHCGNPNVPTIETKGSLKGFTKTAVGLIALLLIFFSIYYLAQNYEASGSSRSGLGAFTDKLSQTLAKGNYGQVFNNLFSRQPKTFTLAPEGTQVPLQEVKNLGTNFYLGQIDDASVNNLTDDLKNQITKIIYDAHVPASILKSTPIIILNNLALTGDQYLLLSNTNLKVPDLKPDFLSEGGVYAPFSNDYAVIFINKSTLTKGTLVDTLTHEFGHAVASKLTDDDWKQFYRLRGIPTDTTRRGTNWNLSPGEDFAEVYKNAFTGLNIRTYYGLLVSSSFEVTCMQIRSNLVSSYQPKFDMSKPASFSQFMAESQANTEAIEAKVSANPSLQKCRRDVLLNPSKYSGDWLIGVPYKSTADQKTKEFIVDIVKRLNQSGQL